MILKRAGPRRMHGGPETCPVLRCQRDFSSDCARCSGPWDTGAESECEGHSAQ